MSCLWTGTTVTWHDLPQILQDVGHHGLAEKTVILVCADGTTVFPVVLSPVTMHRSVPTHVGCVADAVIAVEGMHLRKERPLQRLMLSVSGASVAPLPFLPPSLLFLFPFFMESVSPLVDPTDEPTDSLLGGHPTDDPTC